jgi:hypothetical protein
MEASVAHIDNSLAALLRRFDDLMIWEHDRHQRHSNNNNYDEQVDDNWDEYSADSELDDHDARRSVQHNHHGRGGHQWREVRNNDDVFLKLKFKIAPFDAKYDHDAYISWELAVEQKFTFFEFSENARVRSATSEFSNFASVWWVEYGKKHPNDIPRTLIALKRVMRARFVPSYYARDLINKLQQLKQGAKSAKEYYQELQIGMLHCNLEEREDAAMARFVAGLNREIQDILEYKDYANITRLFHFACKAEREVQGHHASVKTNFSVTTNSWQRNNGHTAAGRVAPSTSNNSSKPRATVTNSATQAPSATKTTPPPTASTASSSRARDIQCHRCKGFGHVMCDCSSKRVLVVRDDGEYSSAGDFDEDTLTLLAADHAGNDDHPEEHIGTGDADH